MRGAFWSNGVGKSRTEMCSESVGLGLLDGWKDSTTSR